MVDRFHGIKLYTANGIECQVNYGIELKITNGIEPIYETSFLIHMIFKYRYLKSKPRAEKTGSRHRFWTAHPLRSNRAFMHLHVDPGHPLQRHRHRCRSQSPARRLVATTAWPTSTPLNIRSEERRVGK